MPVIGRQELAALESKVENIRNICIIAHVDHGKTTLSDSLLATNGIISNKVAGTIRYLDSREDEQERGITMKSSAVALYFKLISNMTGKDGQKESKEREYLIHLIDSPGHVDFSGEVSVASRLCDGALVLVDVVEGVCTQTLAVLRQAWNEGVKPILVLNKIDRLIVELKQTPAEAYNHMARIVEQANAIMASFSNEKHVLEQDRKYEESKTNTVSDNDVDDLCEKEYFNPVEGTVLFSSAYDGWAFRVSDFIALYADKLQVADRDLLNGLWGYHTYDSKQKKIIKQKDVSHHNKNLFSQIILENIWAIYDSVHLNLYDKIEKITKMLNIKITPYELRSKDTRNIAKAVMSQWMPLSRAVLLSVISNLPNPKSAQKSKFEHFLGPSNLIPEISKPMLEQAITCSPTGEVIAFVAKIISVPKSALSKPIKTVTAEGEKLVPAENIDGEALLAFSRVFSGSIKKGQKIYVLGPRYDPSKPTEHIHEVVIENLYFLMGRHYEEVESMSAGNVVAIRGLDTAILKWGTLSTSLQCCSLGFTNVQGSNAVVRVAIEPKDPTKMPELVEGLQLLNQADPVVEILVQETGEHVLLASGELHLERCIRDLKEQFAKIDIQVSAPLVPFRETISSSLNKENDDLVELSILGGGCILRMRCAPLSENILQFISSRSEEIRRIVDTEDKTKAEAFLQEFKQIKSSIPLDRIWAFGPKRVGANILISNIPNYDRLPWILNSKNKPHFVNDLETGILSGFQLATSAGPMCAEPVHGIAYILEDVQLCEENLGEDKRSSLSGQIITAMKELCKQAMTKWSPRLMLAMYSCEVQATSEVLGKVYAVLAKRRGRIVLEEMKEGTDLFTIKAKIPVVESFGFSDDIRKKSSGAAQPQLLFSGWEVLDEDPFWVPTTAEELEELGEKADKENIAKRYMDSVRQRKGMFVEQKVIQPEKQRTMKYK